MFIQSNNSSRFSPRVGLLPSWPQAFDQVYNTSHRFQSLLWSMNQQMQTESSWLPPQQSWHYSTRHILAIRSVLQQLKSTINYFSPPVSCRGLSGTIKDNQQGLRASPDQFQLDLSIPCNKSMYLICKSNVFSNRVWLETKSNDDGHNSQGGTPCLVLGFSYNP